MHVGNNLTNKVCRYSLIDDRAASLTGNQRNIDTSIKDFAKFVTIPFVYSHHPVISLTVPRLLPIKVQMAA